ncbi:hypothetical protein [Bacillus rhizoplanae]|uniref:hypothetical protein n=1 Tax=Bacillus rhizoplanae TaxID=2880966 RepID=UPI003D242955
MWISINDLKEWKDFFPFGSAMLGALIGGFITYRLTKAKERKEAREKRLESLFELQRLNFKLLRSLTDLEIKLKIYISASPEIEDYNVKVVSNKIHECLDELADSHVVALGNAVHISREVFECINKKHDEIIKLFVPVTV